MTSEADEKRKAAFHALAEHHLGQIVLALGGKPQLALVISYEGQPEQSILLSLDDSRLPETAAALAHHIQKAMARK